MSKHSLAMVNLKPIVPGMFFFTINAAVLLPLEHMCLIAKFSLNYHMFISTARPLSRHFEESNPSFLRSFV